jgi:hypothetical protein
LFKRIRYFLELYELTDQFSQVTETSGSSNEAPVLPSRTKAPSEELEDDEEFEKVDDDMEDYQLPDASAPKPGIVLCLLVIRLACQSVGLSVGWSIG